MSMKAAIPVDGNCGLESVVCPRFGRAAGFLIVDTENNDCEFVNNEQNLNAAQGAGIQSAQTIVKAGANLLLTAHCGPKAFKILSTANIGIYLGQAKTAGEFLESWKANKLTTAENCDVEGHWV